MRCIPPPNTCVHKVNNYAKISNDCKNNFGRLSSRFSWIGKRCLKLFTYPIKLGWKKLLPVHYARHIGVKIGLRSKIYGNVTWSTEPYMVEIGNDCHITDGVKFLTHDGAVLLFRNETPNLEIIAPIKLGNKVYVGVNAIFLPGVAVGDNCIIGAGAIVTKDIPSNSVAVGCPAKVIKSTSEYYNKALINSTHVGHLNDKKKRQELLKQYM